MMAKIIKKKKKYDLHMKVEHYVSEKTGIPETDKIFIKE